MEHESFENQDIATIMNEHYVNIKVDREERPDVDQLYMNFIQVLIYFLNTNMYLFIYIKIVILTWTEIHAYLLNIYLLLDHLCKK